VARAKAALYREIGAGGFTHVDGTVEFYQRIQSLLRPDMTVVDFGAGRGKFVEDTVEYRRELHRIQGKVQRVIALDVDPEVTKNTAVDEAYVIEKGSPLPLDSESVDLVVSDWTFEHIDDPAWTSGELDRILKPGGWVCARTPNRWGYIGISARATPNRLHVSVLRRLQPTKAAQDTFPTQYQMNTMRQLNTLFPAEKYSNCSYTMNNEPAYFGSSVVAMRIARAAFKITPDRFAAVLYIFLRKHDG
jgi:ubiquinone/menaquinone biosynthesis C-methylase UbiE